MIEQWGFALVPIPLGSKGPIGKGWNQRENCWRKAEDVPEFYSGNIGLAHAFSAPITCALDIDDYVRAREKMLAYGVNLDALLTDDDAAQYKSGKPNRAKLIFRLPDGMAPFIKINRQDLGFELRCMESTGGTCQDVLPPSAHPDGTHYQWTNLPKTIPVLPASLVKLERELRSTKPIRATSPKPAAAATIETLTPEEEIDLDSALAFLADLKYDGATAAYDAWICTLHDLHCLGDVVGRAKFEACTQRSPYYEPGNEKKWDTCKGSSSHYKNVFTRAIAAGWVAPHKPLSDRERAELAAIDESSRPRSVALRAVAKPIEILMPGLPNELLKPPGILAPIMQWMLATASSPLPEMALHAAVAFGSVMAGQIYEGPTNLRSNLTMIGLARSTFGKDHPQRCLKLLLSRCEQLNVLGGSDIASGPGIVSMLADSASGGRVIYLIDEVDNLLQKALQKNAPAHQREIRSRMMELYSASSDPAYKGPDRANRRENRTEVIPYPHMTFIGFTTPVRFWDAIKGGDVMSGFINRMLVLRASDQRPRPNENKKPMSILPDGVVEWAKAVRGPKYAVEGKLGFGATASNPVMVAYKDEKAKAVLENFRVETLELCDRYNDNGSGLDDAVGRWAENAHKLALIAAVAKHPLGPVIDVECAEWAVGYSRHCGQSVLAGIISEMFDGEFDRAVQQVRAFIAKTGEAGATLSAIANYCRAYRELNESMADQVFKRLIKGGMAEPRRVTRSNGRIVDVWVALDVTTDETL